MNILLLWILTIRVRSAVHWRLRTIESERTLDDLFMQVILIPIFMLFLRFAFFIDGLNCLILITAGLFDTIFHFTFTFSNCSSISTSAP